ncbi:MAG: alpha/beta hydrolase [Candidatus Lambdaproteobacteria bacterium]|nr:alpha/beta hydrolase [Candidatus Lambdaproteobacteria bacterium]
MPYTDAFATLNGCRLHYQDWGRRDAPAILMVHGLTQQSHTFDAVSEQLHGRYRCIALDVRGRGDSAWSGGATYNHRTYVQDVTALLAELGIARFHYMGTSMGGQIGMLLAAQQPAPFLSLTLNDIGPDINPAGALRIGAYVKTVPMSFADFDACIDWAIAQYPWFRGVPRAAVGAAVKWAVQQRDGGGYRFRFDPAIVQGAPTDPALLQKAAAAMWTGLKALPCPVLLVRGAESDILHLDTAAAMARAQPRLIRVDVPGMGHAPTLAEPVVRAALERFFP